MLKENEVGMFIDKPFNNDIVSGECSIVLM